LLVGLGYRDIEQGEPVDTFAGGLEVRLVE